MKIKNFRWWIAGLLALATAINYLDRQALPVVVSELNKYIAISDSQYGMINSIFLFAYGTMYAVGGRIIDILGSRKGYALMVAWWSIANMLHGLVSSVAGLGVARFLLGIGEGGGFPASAKTVSEWFPAKERSTAFGIFNTGSSIGALLAPPLITAIIIAFNWRFAFFISGALGIVWLVCWLKLYSIPARSRYITEEEKQYVLQGSIIPNREQPGIALGENDKKASWSHLFRLRKVWGLLFIKFLTDGGWFFFIFWLPKYLNDVRGLDLKAIGSTSWIPYAFAGLGSLIGGWTSSYLLKKNLSLDRARRIPMAVAATFLPASLFIMDASLGLTIGLFSMAMFGHQCWATIVQTLPADMFPSRIIGTVSGLMGCVGTYGAMSFSLAAGFLIEHYGYHSVFIIAGLLHPASFILSLALIKKIEP